MCFGPSHIHFIIFYVNQIQPTKACKPVVFTKRFSKASTGSEFNRKKEEEEEGEVSEESDSNASSGAAEISSTNSEDFRSPKPASKRPAAKAQIVSVPAALEVVSIATDKTAPAPGKQGQKRAVGSKTSPEKKSKISEDAADDEAAPSDIDLDEMEVMEEWVDDLDEPCGAGSIASSPEVHSKVTVVDCH
ncbi:unnamed protein product [Protopolystoma xenopodis]|uniref:Uncharacterized protein n=1 Tax=Protopolystoma xenopodis TaxID=117903 RepID=A0A448X6C5_9PLAT|nr:unnamed protein product [Protopolystoma xenopodis]